MLFDPKRKPDPSKYILWIGSVHLTESSCYLHSSFIFGSHFDVITAKQHFALTHRKYLLTIWHTFSIVPPML